MSDMAALAGRPLNFFRGTLNPARTPPPRAAGITV